MSPGIACGAACIIGGKLPIPRRKLRPGEELAEKERLKSAIEIARSELTHLRDSVRQEIGKSESDIFDAHLLFLDDPYLQRVIEHKLVDERKNLEQALSEMIEESEQMFGKVDNAYLRERALDIRDVGSRLLDHLLGGERKYLFDEYEDVIIVADVLTPSQAVGLDRKKIRGFITERGGAVSHAAILARSMGVPLVSGLSGVTDYLQFGMSIIVDGYRGQVIIQPSQREMDTYRQQLAMLKEEPDELRQLSELAAETKDGVKITLYANIGLASNIQSVKEAGAEGVGLFRTEGLFLERDGLPDEEEQFRAYRKTVEALSPLPVTFRTLDIGGDKLISSLPGLESEANPYLGMRAIRFSFEHPAVFRDQLRAILRTSAFGKVKILLPMIASLTEIKTAKCHVEEVKTELRNSRIPFDEQIPLGAMIEVPSAAIIIDAILREVDFISIGTNDLVQYTLAVDRSNERVSKLFDPLNPAVLHLLKRIKDAASAAGKEVSICGEMAGDTAYTELLVGLGFTLLSMSSPFIYGVKLVVRTLNAAEAGEVAKKVLTMTESLKVRQALQRSLHAKGIPEILVYPAAS